MQQDDKAPNLETLFDEMDFPATKMAVVLWAEDQGASEEALDIIQSLPAHDYESLAALNRDLSLIATMPMEENLWASQPAKEMPDTEAALSAKWGEKTK